MYVAYFTDIEVSDRERLQNAWHPSNSDKIENIVSVQEYVWFWPECGASHKYESTPLRELKRKSCPICSGLILLDKVNDLDTLRPDMAVQYSPKNDVPSNSHTRLSSYNALWVCNAGHEVMQEVRKKWKGSSSCLVCDMRIIVPYANDFLTLNPHLEGSWDYEKNNVDPRTVKSSSKVLFWWKCDKGHSWNATVNNRVNNDSGCRVCSNRAVQSGVNDSATMFPDLVRVWESFSDNPDPRETLFNTTKVKVKLLCSENHTYLTTPHNINRGRGGCPYCVGNALLKGFNDLAFKAPESLTWWDYSKNESKPDEVSFGSHIKYWFLCPQKHSYKASAQKFYAGKRCPYCAGKKANDENSLSSTYPELMKDWDYERNNANPNDITRGHGSQVWWKCHSCGHSWETYPYNRTRNVNPYGCPKCARGATSSKGEEAVYDFLVEAGIEGLERNRRFEREDGKSFELDIFSEKYNIAVEFNGVYYHSERFVHKNYHKDKYLACAEKGIQLIQIWEDEWSSSPEIVKSMLLHKFGISKASPIYARKTEVKTIPTSEAQRFFNENHIQGFAPASIYAALLFKGEIVSVLSVRREQNGKVFNIVRYATKDRVVGGFTKLLSYLEREYIFDSFLTFSDNCVSDGSLYESSGFVKDGEVRPDYKYLVGKRFRKHKFGYRLSRFRNDPDLLFVEGYSESELAAMNNMLKIYDAGKVRWVRKKTK